MLEFPKDVPNGTPGAAPGAPTAGARTPRLISSVGWNRVNRWSSRLSGVVVGQHGECPQGWVGVRQVVGEAAGVVQQHPDRDRLSPCSGHQPRQVLAGRGIQPDLSLFGTGPSTEARLALEQLGWPASGAAESSA